MKSCLLAIRVPLAFIFVILTNAVSAQTPAWKQMQPPGRSSFSMVFDSLRNKAVLFGGLDVDGRAIDDTWEWDGTQWDDRQSVGVRPPARAASDLAYDSGRGVVVLFGGYRDVTWLGDTWEWNGDVWTQRNEPGPSPRYGHTMLYDSFRNVTVLFGGADTSNNVLREIWEWNGTAWNLRNVVTPPVLARYYHAAAYDSVRRRHVITGGVSASYQRLADIWEWDGNAWYLTVASGPAARSSHAMTYDVARRKTVMSGGYDVNYNVLRDVWEWNGTRWTQRSDGPQRSSHAMAYDPVRHTSLAFGGLNPNTQEVFSDLFAYDGTTWSAPAETPRGRYAHAMSYDSARQKIVMYGGWDGSAYNSETWERSGTSWSRIPVVGPGPRNRHAMAFDSIRNQTVLFGGAAGSTPFNDTWLWDGVSWSLGATTGPSRRETQAMTFDSVRGVVVLFGGYVTYPQTYLGDTWEWNGSSWTERLVSGPPAQGGAKMVFDTYRGVSVLHGGSTAGYGNGGTWEWDGLTWTARNWNGWSSGLAFDSTRGLAVAHGNSEGVNTFLWDGLHATNLYVTGPYALSGEAMAFDSSRQATVVFGGSANNLANATWELRLPCTVPHFELQPVGQVGCIASGASFSVSVVASEPITYQWQVKQYYGPAIWNNLSDGQGELGRVLGGNAPNLNIQELLFRIPRSIRCVVTTSCGTVISESAQLTLCRADFNCDGQVEFIDYMDFVQAFSEGLTGADVNRDQVVDLFDYLDYVQFLLEAC